MIKHNLGYDMAYAEKTFFDSCDGTHILHLIEVFERPHSRSSAPDKWSDVTRKIGDVDDAGELWMVDEDGYNDIVTEEWTFEGRETVGFERAELEAMEDEDR